MRHLSKGYNKRITSNKYRDGVIRWFGEGQMG